MTLYEYRCADCSHEFETVQSMRDESLTDCPECDAASLKRILFGNVTPSSTPTRMNNVPPKKVEPTWEKGLAGERRKDGSFAPYLTKDFAPMHVKEFADNRVKFEKKLRKVRTASE